MRAFVGGGGMVEVVAMGALIDGNYVHDCFLR